MRPTTHHLAWRVDCFCARLNGGLAAVAVVLAVLVAGATAGRELQRLPDPPFAQLAATPADAPMVWGP
jgi:hypothetical protein